jgi:hypothetical protein
MVTAARDPSSALEAFARSGLQLKTPWRAMTHQELRELDVPSVNRPC